MGVQHALSLLLATPENLDEVGPVWAGGSVSPCLGGGGSPRPGGFVQVGFHTPAGSCVGTRHLSREKESVNYIKIK